MVFELLLVFLLHHFQPGLAVEYWIKDVSIDGATPLEIPSNYGQNVHIYLTNVTIWNTTADTYKFLNHSVISTLGLLNCSVSQDFLLPSVATIIITNTNVSDITFANGNNITTDISVSNISLTSIPTNIGQLTQLDHLTWSNNVMTTVDITVLDGHEKLTYFTLFGCSISEITSQRTIQLPSLTGLTLDENQISHIDTQRWIFPNLSFLNLKYNQLTQLPELKQFPKLTEVSLKHNLISNVNDAELLPLDSLYALDLSHNRILQIDSWGSFHFPILKVLNLDRNQLPALDVRNWKMPQLRFFHVEFNQLRMIDGFETISRDLDVFCFDGNSWDCEWVHFAMVDMKQYWQKALAKIC